MADKLLVTVWSNCPKAGPELNLLQAIGHAANETGNCYANLAELAAAARLSYRSAHRALVLLRDERWVATDRVKGQGGRLVYQLNLPKLMASERQKPAAPRAAERAQSQAAVAAELLERMNQPEVMA